MTAATGAAAPDRSTFRVLFAGTPETAVPSLDALVDAGFTVAAVLTRPDAPVGRKRTLTPSPVAARAAELGLPVLHADRLSGEAGREVLDRIAALDLDAAAVVAYGALVPAAGLAVPRHGWVNLHFSLLPAYRGAAPVQHAVIAGEPVTGACVFRLEEGLDTGPVFSRLTRDLAPGETAGAVLADLARSGAALLAQTLAGLQDGTAVAEPQSGEPSLAPKLGQQDGRIDPARPAAEVAARINGTTPEPGAWALLALGDPDAETADAAPAGTDGAVRVKLLGAVAEDPALPDGPGGTAAIDAADAADAAGTPGASARRAGTLVRGRRTVHVRCADGAVRLDRVQPAGKKAMAAADWARGLPAGARFLTGMEAER
ncbi:methionyl-tRNA formyltransferase [Citricoccus sp. SGAir0253]|uniref:methionyl-tRNA formyltransferase n=1 Tax=Citricoccus sp. SGAir0253 TaxID=2567881 RepID=UPI0010CCF7C0|nr:methionyl-tRNA formyltransferase [Citricoccus sp. SGAir0253]QCU78163.1 methionyl-tRNA formyltransferase [Citricoccus sp. SGAir0253]